MIQSVGGSQPSKSRTFSREFATTVRLIASKQMQKSLYLVGALYFAKYMNGSPFELTSEKNVSNPSRGSQANFGIFSNTYYLGLQSLISFTIFV